MSWIGKFWSTDYNGWNFEQESLDLCTQGND